MLLTTSNITATHSIATANDRPIYNNSRYLASTFYTLPTSPVVYDGAMSPDVIIKRFLQGNNLSNTDWSQADKSSFRDTVLGEIQRYQQNPSYSQGEYNDNLLNFDLRNAYYEINNK